MAGPRILPYLALAIAMLAVYAQVATHEFISFDTGTYIYENEVVQRGLTLDGIGWAFTTHAAANWHPLTWLSIMLDCELFGTSPGAHHLMGVAFHLANACLLFALLLRMTSAAWPAFVVAMAWAIHPQHVECVAWAAQRKDVLSTMFMLMACLAYSRYASGPSTGRMAWVSGVYLLGLLAKPMVVTLPVLLLLLDVWPLRRKESWRRLVVEKLPLFTLAVWIGIMTILAQSGEGAVMSTETYPLGLRIANALVAGVAYLGQTVWPFGLCLFYPYPEAVPFVEWAGASALLVGVTAWLWRARRTIPHAFVGWMWYLIALGPVIGIVQVGSQSMADRYSYVPHIGIFIAVAYAIDAVRRRADPPARVWTVGASVVLLFWAIVACVQVGTWQDSETAYRHALSVTERNAKISFNLGVTLSETNPEEAMFHGFNAVEWDPRFPRGRFMLGMMRLQRGDTNGAIEAFREAVESDPEDSEAQAQLGGMLFQQGRAKEALPHLEAAVRAYPDAAQLREMLEQARRASR